MTVYRTTGHLTDAIQPENVAAAQQYLTEDDMAKYVAANANLVGVLEYIEWNLHADGYNYHITAVTNRELDDDELKRLASEVSGQNSDGLGEGFEQQDFAWIDEDCDECGYNGGWGCQCGEGHMCSFDWETNDSTFIKIS